jgi:transposase
MNEEHDRDINAARNIFQEGRRLLAAGTVSSLVNIPRRWEFLRIPHV